MSIGNLSFHPPPREVLESAREAGGERDGAEGGVTFSPALFYVGSRPERFEMTFAGIGAVWVVPGNHILI